MDPRAGTEDRGHGRPAESANEQFKQRAGTWFWASVAAAVVVHFLVLSFGPPMRVVDVVGVPAEEMTPLRAIDILPELKVPAPPERIAPPATPVVAALGIDEDITIEPVRFDEVRFADIPPPPPAKPAEELPGFEHFVPRMVRPELKNRVQVRRALERNYPRGLQNAGVGGQVLFWFWIDEEGAVQKYEIKRSSGHQALDEAAERVVEIMEFSPAVDRGEPAKVIVSLPIIFRVQ